MSFRILLIVAALSFAVADTSAWAQQTNKVPIVGYLSSQAGPDHPIVAAWRQGLRDLGYVDGQNIRLEFRSALGHPDRLPGLAEELVRLKVDVIVVAAPLSARAAKRATSTIPIVTAVLDAVANGLVTDLAHPDGNVTGLTLMYYGLSAKRLQLLKETIPQITRVAVLRNPAMSATPAQTKIVEDLNAAARSLSIELKFVVVEAPEEFEAAFSAVKRARAQALYLVDNPLFYVHELALAKLALKARLPTISATRSFADDGGLMSYGANYADQMRRSAVYVDKILKGAKPGDLPIEQPTKFELVVDLRTAKALGITVPQSILLQADEVIK